MVPGVLARRGRASGFFFHFTSGKNVAPSQKVLV
jgi:hypothetical protein